MTIEITLFTEDCIHITEPLKLYTTSLYKLLNVVYKLQIMKMI